MLTLQELIARLTANTLTPEQMGQLRTMLLERLATPQEGDNVAELATHAATLQGRITEHNASVQQTEQARAALQGATVVERTAQVGGTSTPGTTATGTIVLDRDARGNGGAQDDTQAQRTEVLTLGQAFTRSDGFQQNRAGLQSGVVRQLAATVDTRAVFATTNYPSNATRVPGLFTLPDQPLTFLDMVDRRPIDTNSVEWVREDTPPGGAIEVAEGGAKPESTWAVTLITDTAATIAHFINITRQTMADERQVQGYIEGRLSYGLLKRLNGQIVNGNGTAPNLRGILNTSGIGTYVAGTATEAAIISVRKAKTVAQLSEYEPDAVGMNPVDWEAIELSTDTQGAFRVAPSVQAGAPQVVWGLRVIVTTALTGTTFGTTGGTFLVGGFREGATLWERTAVEIFITDSHASNFTSNILTMLAELRAALSVWRPKAFVKGTFGASRT